MSERKLCGQTVIGMSGVNSITLPSGSAFMTYSTAMCAAEPGEFLFARRVGSANYAAPATFLSGSRNILTISSAGLAWLNK